MRSTAAPGSPHHISPEQIGVALHLSLPLADFTGLPCGCQASSTDYDDVATSPADRATYCAQAASPLQHRAAPNHRIKLDIYERYLHVRGCCVLPGVSAVVSWGGLIPHVMSTMIVWAIMLAAAAADGRDRAHSTYSFLSESRMRLSVGLLFSCVGLVTSSVAHDGRSWHRVGC